MKEINAGFQRIVSIVSQSIRRTDLVMKKTLVAVSPTMNAIK